MAFYITIVAWEHKSYYFVEMLKTSNFTFLKGNILWTYNTWKEFVVYLEGTFYPSISLIENGRDIMPIPQ
jgi:hypothetical protein